MSVYTGEMSVYMILIREMSMWSLSMWREVIAAFATTKMQVL